MIVAATFGPAASTKATASAVVICSNTTFSAGEIADDAAKRPLDEHRLAVEHVDIGVSHLAVDQQRHARALHRGQHRGQRGHVGHAMRRSGGGMRGIELGGGEHALAVARDQIAGSVASVR